MYQTLLLAIVDALRPLIYDRGRYDAVALDRLVDAARLHLATAGTTVTFLMGQAWGQLPAG